MKGKLPVTPGKNIKIDKLSVEPCIQPCLKEAGIDAKASNNNRACIMWCIAKYCACRAEFTCQYPVPPDCTANCTIPETEGYVSCGLGK